MKNLETINILNSLLQITNDRIDGFGKVEGKVWETYSDLKDEYDRMISRSKIMKNELINLIAERGGDPEDISSFAGFLHRTWIDMKNSLPVGNKDKLTLENVVFGESAAVDAYQKALDRNSLDPESAKIVAEHLESLKNSYKNFEDIEKYKKQNDWEN